MNVSFAQCETIMKTLPIGYYAGRRVNSVIDEKAEASFYSLMEDNIVISYPMIAKALASVPDGADVEQSVRSMLYHEVSHAIMTSQHHFPPTTQNNIFEDERIETVLKDYYMNTDFKKQLLNIHGGKIPVPQNSDQAFFNAVRFRCAPDDIKGEVEDIIQHYAKLNRNSEDEDQWYYYQRAIRDLYNKVTKAFHKNPSDFAPPEGQQGEKGGQKSPDQLKQGQGKEKPSGDDEGQEKAMGKSEEDGENGERQSLKGEVPETESPLSEEEIKRMVGSAISKKPPLTGKQTKQLDDFTKTAEMIIGNFNKRNSGGSGINAYSGVFNPRSVVRQDYRYFDRAMTTQGNNKFGTCHLNLFIDSSGSMYHNEEIVNGILASLSEIERKNRNFSMDVSFINHEYFDCKTVRDREYNATGGNRIPDDMKERFIKRQLPNTCNYNIVLFDGDAICNDYATEAEAIKKFSAFDYKQTTLITDPDNERYLGDGFKSAKVVVTKNYTEELISHITKALTIAFG